MFWREILLLCTNKTKCAGTVFNNFFYRLKSFHCCDDCDKHWIIQLTFNWFSFGCSIIIDNGIWFVYFGNGKKVFFFKFNFHHKFIENLQFLSESFSEPLKNDIWKKVFNRFLLAFFKYWKQERYSFGDGCGFIDM